MSLSFSKLLDDVPAVLPRITIVTPDVTLQHTAFPALGFHDGANNAARGNIHSTHAMFHYKMLRL